MVSDVAYTHNTITYDLFGQLEGIYPQFKQSYENHCNDLEEYTCTKLWG